MPRAQPTGTIITLRAVDAPDAEIFAAWERDPVFCAHAGWRAKPTEAESLAWWRDNITRPTPLLQRLLASRDGEPVGFVDLHGDEPDQRELGYTIGPSALWGQGLATAAARAALDYGFTTLGLRRIWAEAVEANTASIRVLQHLGMTRIGFGDEEEFLDKPSRYVRFELLEPDWRHACS